MKVLVPCASVSSIWRRNNIIRANPRETLNKEFGFNVHF